MRTRVDIPESIYRRLKAEAASEGVTVPEIILRLLSRALDGKKAARTKFPLIRGKAERKLRITNLQIEEILI